MNDPKGDEQNGAATIGPSSPKMKAYKADKAS
jgi:hypothetical protein